MPLLRLFVGRRIESVLGVHEHRRGFDRLISGCVCPCVTTMLYSPLAWGLPTFGMMPALQVSTFPITQCNIAISRVEKVCSAKNLVLLSYNLLLCPINSEFGKEEQNIYDAVGVKLNFSST